MSQLLLSITLIIDRALKSSFVYLAQISLYRCMPMHVCACVCVCVCVHVCVCVKQWETAAGQYSVAVWLCYFSVLSCEASEEICFSRYIWHEVLNGRSLLASTEKGRQQERRLDRNKCPRVLICIVQSLCLIKIMPGFEKCLNSCKKDSYTWRILHNQVCTRDMHVCGEELT